MEENCVPDLTELLCSSQVFPYSLPEEFTLIFTLALKKAALRDTIYLFQISDQQGYPQVHLTFCFLHIFHSPVPLSYSPLLTLARSITFCASFAYSSYQNLISLLHSHPLSPSISSLWWHLFNSFSPFIPCSFCPLLFFIRSPSLLLPVSLSFLPWSSSALLFHSPSLLFMCVSWWRTGVS